MLDKAFTDRDSERAAQTLNSSMTETIFRNWGQFWCSSSQPAEVTCISLPLCAKSTIKDVTLSRLFCLFLIKMRKGCNVCKVLDTLPKKQSSPGLEKSLGWNTRGLFTHKETKKFRAGPTEQSSMDKPQFQPWFLPQKERRLQIYENNKCINET